MPLNEISPFQSATNNVCIWIKELKFERMVDSGDELYNVASNSA
jgi:hypothetical protein